MPGLKPRSTGLPRRARGFPAPSKWRPLSRPGRPGLLSSGAWRVRRCAARMDWMRIAGRIASRVSLSMPFGKGYEVLGPLVPKRARPPVCDVLASLDTSLPSEDFKDFAENQTCKQVEENRFGRMVQESARALHFLPYRQPSKYIHPFTRTRMLPAFLW